MGDLVGGVAFRGQLTGNISVVNISSLTSRTISIFILLVVGAPKGKNSTEANYTLPLGNIHVCDAFSDACGPVSSLPTLDSEDTSRVAVTFGEHIRKQGIGFGETLFTRDSSKSKLLACAPRYVIKTKKGNEESLQSRGACYVLDSVEGRTIRLVPYPGKNYILKKKPYVNTFSLTGFGLAGMSATISQDERDTFMGAPYAFYGQGMLIKTTTSISNPVANKDVYGPATLDFYMEGWAMVIGKFDGTREILAVSTLGYGNSRGQVSFHNTRLAKKDKYNIKGEFGTQFGFCLAAGDLDGDGVVDLLVGAPMALGKSGLLPDAGKVMVFYAPLKQEPPLSPSLVLEGNLAWGLFGKAAAFAGDLNQDGYGDVVVGAPGGDGRVYVFNGGVGGLHATSSQILEASEFSPGLRGFGFSLDGGLDMDDNSYPDLIVGSPESDKVVFLRSAPTITLMGQVRFDPQVIDAQNRSCKIQRPDGGETDVACFQVEIDLQYRTKNDDKALLMEFEIELDGEQQRLGFMSQMRLNNHKLRMNHSVTSQHKQTNPLILDVYIKPGRLQFNISASVVVDVTIPPTEAPAAIDLLQDTHHVVPAVIPSIMDVYGPTSFSAHARMGCVDLASCYSKPDIILHAYPIQPQLVVGEEEFAVQVVVEISQDMAYDVKLHLSYPSGVEYVRISSESHLPVCVDEGDLVTCSFDFDLNEDEKIRMTFRFRQIPMTLLAQEDPALTFHMNVTTESKDINEHNNQFNLTIAKVYKLNLQIQSMSDQEVVQAQLNNSLSLEDLNDPSVIGNSTADNLGPHVKHSLLITNQGPTPFLGAKIIIQLPPYLYRTTLASTSGPVRCTSPPSLNHLNFTTETTRNSQTRTALIAEEDEEGTGDEGSQGSLTVEEETGAGNLTRTKREASVSYSTSTASPTSSTHGPHIATIDCNSDKIECEKITCEVSTMMAGSSISVEISQYVMVAVLKLYHLHTYNATTIMNVDITQPCVVVNGQSFTPDLHNQLCHHEGGEGRGGDEGRGGEEGSGEEGDEGVEGGGQTTGHDQDVNKEYLKVLKEDNQNTTGNIARRDEMNLDNDTETTTTTTTMMMMMMDEGSPGVAQNNHQDDHKDINWEDVTTVRPNYTYTTSTLVTIKEEDVPQDLADVFAKVGPWPIFGAVLGAILLIIIISGILVYSGFFKRTKYEELQKEKKEFKESLKRRTRIEKTDDNGSCVGSVMVVG
ncbi:integrin alpha-8-like isoform X2 [Homarus americanus]|uniref:integrin alpha-8-like isoform X2 n=1 Tax=Homarus americanus TaxID=6706 RepID=UPI001C489B6B|nr:integrin alpha-8-like isoform X2 [Homarus americanus]